MAKSPTTALYSKRRTTQEFLYSRSEENQDAATPGEVEPEAGAADSASAPAPYPDLLDRKALIGAVETRLENASILSTIALEIHPDRVGGPAPAAGGAESSMPRILEAFFALGGETEALRGQLSANRFALVVAGHDQEAAMETARGFLARWPDPATAPVTIGIAMFPTLAEGRGQSVENADKALDHGGFFGPGTITAFDAVSLNISGDRHYQAGDIDRAIDDFKKGLQLDPEDVNLHNSLGVCYGVLNDHEHAFEAFDRAIARSPNEIMPIYNKGYLMLLDGNREEALGLFQQAQAIEPDIFEVVFHIGQTLMEMGDPKGAEPYLTTAVAANDRSGTALKLLGDCLATQGAIRNAMQAYKRAVKINPEDADSLSSLGWLYSRIEESLDVAEVLCSQSVRLAPENGLFHHRLGEVYMKQGTFEAALAQFETAIAMGHDSSARLARANQRMQEAKAS